jgi:hypothetical protein
MAVRKAVSETFMVDGPRDEWLTRCSTTLEQTGFKQIQTNATLGQIQADFHKATTWGSLALTLTPNGDDRTTIVATATANADNVFALFKSPGRKILDAFKSGMA